PLLRPVVERTSMLIFPRRLPSRPLLFSYIQVIMRSVRVTRESEKAIGVNSFLRTGAKANVVNRVGTENLAFSGCRGGAGPALLAALWDQTWLSSRIQPGKVPQRLRAAVRVCQMRGGVLASRS